MGRSNSNPIHRPITIFFYGSILIIMMGLGLGAYYLSTSFLEKEQGRSEITKSLLNEGINSDYRYIVEEFFTKSYESVFLRIKSSLKKFSSPNFDLYLYSEQGQKCVFSKNQDYQDIPCFFNKQGKNFVYEADLNLAGSRLGSITVVMEDRFQFMAESVFGFVLQYGLPIFLFILSLWLFWFFLSKKYFLIPYYQKAIQIEKEKISANIIRQIIHDTQSEIATLDLQTYDLLEQDKASEIRKTLGKIRDAFGNISHHKDGIVTTVREIPHFVFDLMNELMEQSAIKYKKNTPKVTINFDSEICKGIKIKVDSNTFYRVFSNLLENAVAVPCHESQKNITVHAIKNENRISISVQDNGTGIDEVVISKIFAKGFTTKIHGTGQGLSYIKETTEGWGGNVYVKTKFNGSSGSIFTVEIPIYEIPNIVILDDDQTLLYRYKQLLEKFHRQVDVFSDISTLLKQARTFQKGTVFLLDFNLGEQRDGSFVAKRLFDLGMREIFFHTGNSHLRREDFPFIKGILTKGNFLKTIEELGLN